MYYLFLLTALVFSNINLFSTNFLQSNSKFLDSKIKKIEFNYLVKGSQSLDQGHAKIIISDTCYKFSRTSDRYQNIILSNTKVQKTYNQYSNQIFIDYPDFAMDSLILNIFNDLDINLNKYFTVNLESKNIIEYDQDNMKIQIFTNNNFVDSVTIANHSAKIKLFSIKLSPYTHNSFNNPFSLDAPNAFILDLRD